MIRWIDDQFVDEFGRSVLLRGVNLPAKTPARTHSFYESTGVSYVGRPWPLEVAEEHAQNLRKLGMNWVRLCVPWEAVMPKGPNEFDEEYLTYFGKLIDIFEKHEIFVDIDPHQDAFSRFSGGSGAPKWVFDLVGLIPENFYDTLAALTEYEFLQHEKGPFPYLIWQANLSKLAAMTLFTLFWAGDTYAPKFPIEHFLQEQYLLFVKSVVERVRHKKNILGVATMNELSLGYIGNTNLNKVSGSVKLRAMPTPLEGFALADGQAVSVTKYGLGMLGLPVGKVLCNEKKVKAWKGNCLWKEHGVWDYDFKGNPVILKKNYFQMPNNKSFADDFYKPFAKTLYYEVKQLCEKVHVILQTQEFVTPPDWHPEGGRTDVLFDRHWYDPIMTALKWYQNLFNVYEVSRFPVFFKFFIDRAVRIQFARLKKMVWKYIGDAPLLLGETGVVMDLYHGLFYKGPATKKNNYAAVAKGADRLFRAIESDGIHVSIWNYDIFNTLEGG